MIHSLQWDQDELYRGDNTFIEGSKTCDQTATLPGQTEQFDNI